jgi:hypothetical protein
MLTMSTFARVGRLLKHKDKPALPLEPTGVLISISPRQSGTTLLARETTD